MTRTYSTDTLITCYKCPCRQRHSKLVNLEAERDEKSAIQLCTLVFSVCRDCFLYISIWTAVHSRSFRAQSNKLISWQLFHILNISISNPIHPHNEILFKDKSISVVLFDNTNSDSDVSTALMKHKPDHSATKYDIRSLWLISFI